MTPGTQTTVRWWRDLAPRQVTLLTESSPEVIRISLDPLPEDAPALVQFRPAAADSFGDQVGTLLDELDRAAMSLYPRWLPGAERFDGSGTLGLAAVRALAMRTARTSADFGPFLIDLAERSLRSSDTAPPFAAEVRAAGLARVIAAAYGREHTAVMIEVPEGLTEPAERSLLGAAEWLAGRGRYAVWLTGDLAHTRDRVAVRPVSAPEQLARLDVTAPEPVEEPAEPPLLVTYPPISGSPHPGSLAEQTLERALRRHAWAQGREWNRVYETGVLARPYRLDLFWREEQLIVEIDGAEHRERVKWADDRDRDNRLQSAGHKVLRFPNERVLTDVQFVVQQIQQILIQRRSSARIPEMRHHAD
ncbi:MAG: DUF559 domain-containing protein [Hamadaea sp.]|uniref:endonuclease domain-containing protein n=1 Tax=Hamadaea sp. TaxID=2024425 RepID=UPI001831AC68|nr:DUF559 domain-containing protein [Hamadaea sp.]NUR72153.1 DUF559 domain-containing protein [Hamadaea sp.]NUT22720.1 DUF559 domain-containing protein [Hamadaea sp.]